MHTFFIWAGQRLRSFFYAQIDTEIGTIPLYVRILATPVRVQPPLPADKIPRKTLYLAFCGDFLFGMRILLEWILERGNGENVGRCDLISEGVLPCFSQIFIKFVLHSYTPF